MLGPIFLRELLTVPRRGSHYVTRAAYLGSLWVVAVTAWLATLGWTRSATLGETARFGPLLFLVLYLLVVHGLGALSGLSGVATPEQVRLAQRWLEPFLALQSAHQALPDEQSLLTPAYGYAVVMVGVSVLLSLVAMMRLRVW